MIRNIVLNSACYRTVKVIFPSDFGEIGEIFVSVLRKALLLGEKCYRPQKNQHAEKEQHRKQGGTAYEFFLPCGKGFVVCNNIIVIIHSFSPKSEPEIHKRVIGGISQIAGADEQSRRFQWNGNSRRTLGIFPAAVIYKP